MYRGDFDRSTQDLHDQIIFCHDVKKLCKKVAIDWQDQQKTESNKNQSSRLQT